MADHALRVVLLVLMLPAAPTGEAAEGAVHNVGPTFARFAASAAESEVGVTELLAGVIEDQNGEGAVVWIGITVFDPEATPTDPNATAPPIGQARRNVTPADLQRQVEPPDFDDDGWKVWNTVDRDGRLQFSFAYVYMSPGNRSWQAQAGDDGNLSSGSGEVLVRVHEATGAGGGGSAGGGGGGGSAGGGGGGGSAGGGGGGSAGGGAGGGGAGGSMVNASDGGENDGGAAPATGAGGGGPGAGPGPDDGKTSDGTPGDLSDGAGGRSFDVTDATAAQRDGPTVHLSWDPVRDAGGYQVWRQEPEGGWHLLTVVDAAEPRLLDGASPPGARYKVTYFLADEARTGLTAEGAAPAAIPGWQEEVYRQPEDADLQQAPQPADTSGGATGTIAGLVAGTVAALWFFMWWRRRRRGR